MSSTPATPTVVGGKAADSNATVYSANGAMAAGAATLAVGQMFDGRYRIISKIGRQTSQAGVYVAQDTSDAAQVAIKVYDSAFKPDYDILEKLRKIDSPYLAKLLAYSNCGGAHYEVYRYYKNATVADRMKEKPFSFEYIEKVAVVSINEALRTLHEIGVVHADVKPENILISDDEQALVLSDYGISVNIGKDGYAFKEIQGTLAYAPKAEQHFNKTKIDAAWDYGSFGLVLAAMACGVGIFDRMDNEEICLELEKGIELPAVITGRLRALISGLIMTESDKRFGYKEVARWCEGDIVKTGFKRALAVEKNVLPLTVAIVDNKTVTVRSPEEFAREILKNWSAAKSRIFENPSARNVIKGFLSQFGEGVYESVSRFIDNADKDKALFCVAYTISPLKDIYYMGKHLGKLEGLFQTENVAANADELVRFIKSDLLDFYLEINGYDKSVMSAIKALSEVAGEDTRLMYCLLMYSFAPEKILQIGERSIKSMDDMAQAVIELGVDAVMADENKTAVYAWLYCMGYGKEVNLMRKRDGNEQ